MNIQEWKNSWLGNVRMDILSGITVALALIPEAIAFSIIAGVDPMVGLYASFCIAVVISLVGSRLGMISAATGAMALVMVTLVKEHGVEYLFAATVLTGIIQVVLGVLRTGRFLTFIPHPVMIGFVNALAIMIFSAQLVHFEGASWIMYAIVAATLLIIYVLPRFTKAVPSALVAIITMTVITVFAGLDVKTVGDLGEITQAPPVFHLPVVPLTLETLRIILPVSLTLAVVGLLESGLTARIIDEMTESKSDKNVEFRGQGIANIVTGIFGGMAGCAMIGQSVINVRSGGRGRLSTFTAGVCLLFLIIVLGDVVKEIPIAALVGVMIMVSIGTFDWASLRTIRKVPLMDTIVMLTTVGVVVYTHDLARGVLAGVVLSAVMFGWRMAKIRTKTRVSESGVKIYTISGQLFFGTMNHFVDLFDIKDDPQHVVIDFASSHVWDQSAVAGISKVMHKYGQVGKQVTITGLNEDSRRLVERIGLAPVSHS